MHLLQRTGSQAAAPQQRRLHCMVASGTDQDACGVRGRGDACLQGGEGGGGAALGDALGNHAGEVGGTEFQHPDTKQCSP